MNKLYLRDNLLSQINLPKGILIRQFNVTDFPMIKKLYEQAGWMTFINRSDEALEAWENSAITLLAVEGDKIVGLARALTDGKITTYVAEIIVDNNYRRQGIGYALLEVCHCLYPHTRLDLLSTEGADEFYQSNKFRTVTGFRKSYL